jgi:hypothetical protein
MKNMCYNLQNVGETTGIAAADKEEEGRGNSLIQSFWQNEDFRSKSRNARKITAGIY